MSHMTCTTPMPHPPPLVCCYTCVVWRGWVGKRIGLSSRLSDAFSPLDWHSSAVQLMSFAFYKKKRKVFSSCLFQHRLPGYLLMANNLMYSDVRPRKWKSHVWSHIPYWMQVAKSGNENSLLLLVTLTCCECYAKTKLSSREREVTRVHNNSPTHSRTSCGVAVL